MCWKLCGQTSYLGLTMKRWSIGSNLSVYFPATRAVVGTLEPLDVA